MKKCPYCAEEIQDEAVVCKHCGRDLTEAGKKQSVEAKKKGNGCLVAFGVVAGLLVLIYLAATMSKGTSKTVATQSSRANNSQAEVQQPALQLKNWTWAHEYDFAIAKGQVKNISNEKLASVEAVLSTYDKDGNFINSGDTLIDYNPILPGQTSPFKVMITWNPAMKKAGIEFKTLMGGTVPYTEKTDSK